MRVCAVVALLLCACGGGGDDPSGGTVTGSAGTVPDPSGDASTGAESTPTPPGTTTGPQTTGMTAPPDDDDGEGSSGSGGPELPPTCTECPGEPCTRDCLPPIPDGPAELPPYSQGTCPQLVAGALNEAFGFNGRDFMLHVPTSTNGPYAVIFAFHGAGGSADEFDDFFGDHFDTGGYILVVPDGGDLYDSDWYVEETPGQKGPPPQDDLLFFDDVLTCLAEQFPLDLRRVHTTGFSVGARFSAYLMGHRSNRVGSFTAWSGGNLTPQGITVVPSPDHAIPGLLFHGGPGDVPACCGFDSTHSLLAAMAGDDQFAIACDHGGGHSIPGGALDHTLAFSLAHPFSSGNTAAWRDDGLPADFPEYCVAQ